MSSKPNLNFVKLCLSARAQRWEQLMILYASWFHSKCVFMNILLASCPSHSVAQCNAEWYSPPNGRNYLPYIWPHKSDWIKSTKQTINWERKHTSRLTDRSKHSLARLRVFLLGFFASHCSTFPCVTGSRWLVALHPSGAYILRVWHLSSKYQHQRWQMCEERQFTLCNVWPTENGTHREGSFQASLQTAHTARLLAEQLRYSISGMFYDLQKWKQCRKQHRREWRQCHVCHQREWSR